ncbi:TIGR02453 family protein [Aestuariivivens marinum]|uniref:TIGR02453 family protein n=1 Tax=Aestuariivivens marinum TaxID=2913555 RepID=UPI001F592F9C|nr:TIGR02453 family protein [Aestuariivivens marinum]
MEAEKKYFTRAYISFFEALERNNNREWFVLNESKYEHDVNEPFNRLVEDVLETVKSEDSSINIQVSDAVFRIQKDMRFNKDGNPYKLFKSALISAKGRKHREVPGFYIEIGAKYIKIAMGCFKLSPTQMKKIEYHMNQINVFTENARFKSTFGELIRGGNSAVFQTIIPVHIIDNVGLNQLLLTYWQMSKPVIDTFKTILNGQL